MQTAAKSACFAWLIAATSSAGFIDLGLAFFSFAAVACTTRTLADTVTRGSQGRGGASLTVGTSGGAISWFAGYR